MRSGTGSLIEGSAWPAQQNSRRRWDAASWYPVHVTRMLILIGAAGLIILLPRLVVVALRGLNVARRRRHIAGLPVLRLRLRGRLRVVKAATGPRRRVDLLVGAAIGRIDVTVIGPLLAGVVRLLVWIIGLRGLIGLLARVGGALAWIDLRRDHRGLAGGNLLLVIGLSRGLCRGAAGDLGGRTRISGERNRGGAGQGHRGVEHTLL